MPERDTTRIKLPALLFLAAAASAQTIVVHPSKVPGVTMTGPRDAPYGEEVDRILGPVRPPSMTGWLPYGVVVSNGTSQTIVAVAVRWVTAGANGMARTYTFPYEMFGRAPRQIQPGKSVLSLFDMQLFDGPPRPALESLFQNRMGRLAEIQGATNTDVYLDGVVYASGQFAGPDTMHEFESWQAETTAAPLLAAQVVAKKGAGEPTANIVSWLQATAPLEKSHDLTEEVTGRTARQLVQTFNRSGEARFYQEAGSEAQPLIKLYRE